MKVLIVFVLLATLNSCSKDRSEEILGSSEFMGKWQLVRMVGNWHNSETKGDAMAWQEFYVFNADSTFIKSRKQKGEETTATGIFWYDKNNNGEEFLHLTYKTESIIAGSCYGKAKETLYVATSKSLESSWRDCDGPGLEYQKVSF